VSLADFDLKHYLKQRMELANQALERLLPPAQTPPARLHEAMRYSVFAGGKRLRPILVLASAEALRKSPSDFPREAILEAGAAVEFLHTYSLIHDDLPAMDNDDLRRGQPTCHKAFDEATAILAGDALQALAFQTLARLTGVEGDRRASCIAELAEASGCAGMVGGQMEDLLCEGCTQPRPEQVEFIHRLKTAALIRACCGIGATLAGGSSEEQERLREYGTCLGLAFQIVDDILDIVGEEKTLGKTVGKDQSVSKATYPAVYGLEQARRKADQLIEQAKQAVSASSDRGFPLRALADYVSVRDR
jgi:geranylgeranyl diphosphate synthase type II